MLRLAEHVGRQEAHDAAYRVAMATRPAAAGGGVVGVRRPFAERLAADPALADRLTPGEIAALLAPEAYTGLAATSAREVAGGAPPAAGNRP